MYTDRQTTKQTDRQKNSQTDRQAETEKERARGRKREREKESVRDRQRETEIETEERKREKESFILLLNMIRFDILTNLLSLISLNYFKFSSINFGHFDFVVLFLQSSVFR